MQSCSNIEKFYLLVFLPKTSILVSKNMQTFPFIKIVEYFALFYKLELQQDWIKGINNSDICIPKYIHNHNNYHILMKTRSISKRHISEKNINIRHHKSYLV